MANPALDQRLDVAPLPLALHHVLGLEIVQHDAPLEEGHQQERVHRVAQVVGPPLLPLVHPQDAVADVAVLADDVRVGVVDVVVGVLPLLARADRVPLVHAGVEARVAHPVVLPVHHVVPDLHVVEDLRDRQGGDGERPRGWHVEKRAARHLELLLSLHHLPDVRRIRLDEGFELLPQPEVREDPLAERIHLPAELLELLGGQGRACRSHGSSFRVRGRRRSRRQVQTHRSGCPRRAGPTPRR